MPVGLTWKALLEYNNHPTSLGFQPFIELPVPPPFNSTLPLALPGILLIRIGNVCGNRSWPGWICLCQIEGCLQTGHTTVASASHHPGDMGLPQSGSFVPFQPLLKQEQRVDSHQIVFLAPSLGLGCHRGERVLRLVFGRGVGWLVEAKMLASSLPYPPLWREKCAQP